jgi:microcystin-dependent protein
MPNEPIKGLNTPNTGDLVGSWGTTALNANFQAIGGMLGGVLNFSLSGATTVVLTGPSGSLTPGAGPTQQQNMFLNFSGAQTGNAQFAMSLPGTYTVINQCTGTTAYLQFVPAVGTGTYIAVPQGRATQIFFDGVNVGFLNPQDPGTAYDLHGATSLPLWMQACKVRPYLQKDGTVYNVSDYPALAQILGSTFGGNGITAFGVPDELSRVRLAWDFTGSSLRVTAAGCGINGAQMGAAGGNQFMQSHTHTSPALSDPGHNHTPQGGSNFWVRNGPFTIGPGGATFSDIPTTNTTTAGITIAPNVGVSGGGTSQNMQPTIVSFLALIKT